MEEEEQWLQIESLPETCRICCREGSGQRREGKEMVKPHGEMQEGKYFKAITAFS